MDDPHRLGSATRASGDLASLPTRLNLHGEAADGLLVFWRGALTAVLSRTSLDDPDRMLGWSLEYGAGPCDLAPAGRVFSDLGAALVWIGGACGASSPHGLA